MVLRSSYHPSRSQVIVLTLAVVEGWSPEGSSLRIFERMTERDPNMRATICKNFKQLFCLIEEIQNHVWMKGDCLDSESLVKEIALRNQIVQKVRDSLVSEEAVRKSHSSQSLSDDDDAGRDEEQQRLLLADAEEFERARASLVEEVERMRARLKAQRCLRRHDAEEEKHPERMEQVTKRQRKSGEVGPQSDVRLID